MVFLGFEATTIFLSALSDLFLSFKSQTIHFMYLY